MLKIIIKHLTILLVSIFICGCSVNNSINSVDRFDAKSETTEDKAELLSKEITSLNEIKSATVIINGKSALVNIEIQGEASDKELTVIKNKVERRIKELDKNITQVGVTSAAELINDNEMLE